jgi:error-prone DNA polymerase
VTKPWTAAAPAGPREPEFISGDRKRLLFAAPPPPDAAGRHDAFRGRAKSTVPSGLVPPAAPEERETRAVRIGIEYVTSIGEDDAAALVAERERGGPFRSVRELAQRAPLRREGLEALISSGACAAFGGEVRPLLWEAGLAPRSASVPGSGGEERQLALPMDPTVETPELPEPSEWERMLTDYRTTSLTIGVHPLELLRSHLPQDVLSSHDLSLTLDRTQVAVAGMAVARQRPATANGVVFMLLEDEFGQMNLIVPPTVYDRHRAIVRGEPLILARGRFERQGRNQNVLVRELETLGPLARKVADVPELGSSLPPAHHFGHR